MRRTICDNKNNGNDILHVDIGTVVLKVVPLIQPTTPPNQPNREVLSKDQVLFREVLNKTNAALSVVLNKLCR